MHSLAVGYEQINATALTLTLQDRTCLGLANKALLDLQRQRKGVAPVEELRPNSASSA